MIQGVSSEKKKIRPPALIAVPLIVVIGIALAYGITITPVVFGKVRGEAPGCPWDRIVRFPSDHVWFEYLLRRASAVTGAGATDPRLAIECFSAPGRKFWIKRSGEGKAGRDLLAYLLAEHDWVAGANPRQTVRSGDTVLDCGAHVGVFVSKALALGAARVVAIEPLNLECLRRNFAAEISQRRVFVVPAGVWSREGSMRLQLSDDNSGMNSMVVPQTGTTIDVPVTTIDKLVESLSLDRVDFIKMDIEGAEREALQGATRTLTRFRPRMMLDSYHLPDDVQVLPAILRRAHPDYRSHCGPCEPGRGGQLVPHVTFYD